MYDVAERIEVGVLEFSKSIDPFDREISFDLPDTFGAVVAIEKLVIEEQDVIAESGIAFRNARHEEIVIVPGAQPYGLAVRIPWTGPVLKFAVEYPLDRYNRVAMS
jgi:hypothetical protein